MHTVMTGESPKTLKPCNCRFLPQNLASDLKKIPERGTYHRRGGGGAHPCIVSLTYRYAQEPDALWTCPHRRVILCTPIHPLTLRWMCWKQPRQHRFSTRKTKIHDIRIICKIIIAHKSAHNDFIATFCPLEGNRTSCKHNIVLYIIALWGQYYIHKANIQQTLSKISLYSSQVSGHLFNVNSIFTNLMSLLVSEVKMSRC